MGYDVNYNELDYARAGAICQRAFADVQTVVNLLRSASLAADTCQTDLNMQCMTAGIGARGYSLGALAEELRAGMFVAQDAVKDGKSLAERVATSMDNYESAEDTAERFMLSLGGFGAISDFISETWQNGLRPPTENMESFLRMLLMNSPTKLLNPKMTISEQVEDGTTFLTRIIRRLSQNDDKEIVISSSSAPEKVEVDGNLNSYFQMHQMLESGQPKDNGEFMVVKADNGTYVVIMPGTQNGQDFPTPFDELGIVDAFGIESENFVAPLTEALELSGAKDGDEIILSGYSQGGIHVAQLMKNKVLNKKFKLTKMLTLGSPIGNIDIPEDVRSLSVEDSKDMVPGTDGRRNPNRGKEHYTTTFDGPREQMKDLLPQGGLFGPPHNLNNYGDHLRELDEKPKPEIREHLKLFHLPQKLVEVRKFKIERKEKERKPLTEEQKERISRITPGQ